MKGRECKRRVRELLQERSGGGLDDALAALDPNQAIHPVIGCFCHPDDLVRARAIRAAGVVARNLYHQEPERLRIVMRRLIWMLNDESGGIGWGVPEAMAEILVTVPEIAGEYHRIFASYIDPDGNYLEHPVLQRGVMWGLARVAEERPDLLNGSAGFLLPYLETEDPLVATCAMKAAAGLHARALADPIRGWILSKEKVRIPETGELVTLRVGEVAEEVLETLNAS